jgi:hypothetical protein
MLAVPKLVQVDAVPNLYFLYISMQKPIQFIQFLLEYHVNRWVFIKKTRGKNLSLTRG